MRVAFVIVVGAAALCSRCIAPTQLTTFGTLPDRAERTTVLVVAAEGTYAQHKPVIDVVAAAFREVDYSPFTDGTIVTPTRGPEVVISTLDTSYRRQSSLPIRTQLFDSPNTDCVAVVTGRATTNRISAAAISVSDRATGELLYTLDITFTPARSPIDARDILAIKLEQAMGRLPKSVPQTSNKYGLPTEYRGYNGGGQWPQGRPIDRN